MSLIEGFEIFRKPSRMGFTVQMDVAEGYLNQTDVMLAISEKIVEIVATEYAKEHGPEILRKIHEQTVDHKVIQKVISNLRKEMGVQS